MLPLHSRPNDASQVLRLMETCVITNWNEYYATKAKLMETFVDVTRFDGASYKAANWRCIGLTKGYRKCGANYSNGQTAKLIFVRPLDKRTAKRLAKV